MDDELYSYLYDELFAPTIKSIIKKRNRTIVHNETCPVCGKKRCNVYKRNDEWKCKECWDKETKEEN